jgi:putative hydrolase of the HAD superfamily
VPFLEYLMPPVSTSRIVFDLDDTLYPERSFAVSAFAEIGAWARETLGAEGLAADMTRLLDAGHLGQLFGMVLAQRGLDATHADTLIDVYRQHRPARLDLYPDAARVLDWLAASGPLGLITDGTVPVQQAKVQALGVASRFGHIVYTHAAGGRQFAKPHPVAFEAMQAAIGRAGDRFVYVGDNPAKDFQAPNRLGWTTVHIVRPQRIHANAVAIEDGEPHHVIATLDELPALLSV